jgi:predicted alpha/beta-hydrolase family hydrolase
MHMLFDGDEGAAWTVLLAHGAGQPMDSPFMNHIAAGLAARGEAADGLRVVRFEFPYMQATRGDGRRRAPDAQPVLLDAFREALAELVPEPAARRRTLVGGKSLGGRMASLLCDEMKAGGLACLGYPFHPPGRPEQLRVKHLLTLATPALICQGTRDPFGTPAEVAGYALPASIRLHWLEDGDHDFKPRKASGRSERQNLDEAIDAMAAFAAALARR